MPVRARSCDPSRTPRRFRRGRTFWDRLAEGEIDRDRIQDRYRHLRQDRNAHHRQDAGTGSDIQPGITPCQRNLLFDRALTESREQPPGLTRHRAPLAQSHEWNKFWQLTGISHAQRHQ